MAKRPLDKRTAGLSDSGTKGLSDRRAKRLLLVDTHCHIHEILGSGGVNEKWRVAGVTDPDLLITVAAEAGVTKLLCVGTTLPDSRLAIEFVQSRPNCWATIGIHPHEASKFVLKNDDRHKPGTILEEFTKLAGRAKVVAVGECGLDYFYNHSPKADQEKVLRFQIELALTHDVPLIFHVREAFADFWPIFDSYRGIRGVVHSFSAGQKELDEILSRNLYVGLNGIMTFTKDPEQLTAARAIPLQKLLLETDAPFLTPAPHRGTINEPKHVRRVAEFLASLRDEHLEALAAATTTNAQNLFGLEK